MSLDQIFRRSVTSIDDTAKIAQEISSVLEAGDLLAFYGDLGSGKTATIKLICAELQVKQEVTSPSFTLINEYQTHDGQRITHFDFYRVESGAELVNLGIDDYFYSDDICMVEWADRVESELPTPRYEVRIGHDPATDVREISFGRVG